MLPPIFLVDIFVDNIKGGNTGINFTTLSSGEKQLIYSLNSIYYHLTNLYSVKESTDKNKIIYKNINIVFEEIEMYFHPDYQRKFIGQLLEGVKSLELKHINLNIILVTHSPFILSDIPNENIMFLNLIDGKANQIKENKNTLGANIYDILADSFFFNDKVFMGEFIRNKINETIFYINEGVQDSNHEKFKSLIRILDEPILQKKLEQMFNDKFKESSATIVEKEIESIKRRLDDLGYTLIKKH